jgi:hyperosmotically inducible protein
MPVCNRIRSPRTRNCNPVTQENIMIKEIALASALAITAITFTGCAVVRDQQSAGSYVDDATITTRVKARFADDPSVSAIAIQVGTLRGAVQISGFSKSSAERSNAETIARGVPGVARVINNITVRP